MKTNPRLEALRTPKSLYLDGHHVKLGQSVRLAFHDVPPVRFYQEPASKVWAIVERFNRRQRYLLAEKKLKELAERGAQAWRDTPDAGAWVDELRGNCPSPSLSCAVTIEQFEAYLHSNQWLQTGKVRNVATIWRRHDDPDAEVVLPQSPSVGDHKRRIRAALEAVALHENRRIAEVIEAIATGSQSLDSLT